MPRAGRRPTRVLVVTDSRQDWHRHNYASAVLALEARVAALGGGVSIIDIYHDEWCAANRGGYCDCEPDVRLRGDPADN